MNSEQDAPDIDLLIVDDDQELLGTTAKYFRRRGFRVQEASSGEEALQQTEERAFEVAVLDMVMPGMSGLELLEKMNKAGTECQVVFLTGKGTIETAVDAMKQGAHDFLTKPVRLTQLETVVRKAHESGRLKKENRQLRAFIKRCQPETRMIGSSAAMQDVFRLIERAGPTNKPVLIQGESGTGKELVARALHCASRVADKPLVVINCAALPDTLLESELFGHEKGAFTGATTAKPGLFEVADGGSLFIDEIGELSGLLQPKLLRVLEDGSMRRVGSLKERRVRVRLIAASNRDLQEEVRAKRFREDLYYRINVMTLQLPPLRNRKDDIPALVENFCGLGWTLSPDAMDVLVRHHWPGNVRQLINAIERAKIMADDEVIRVQDLPPEVTGSDPSDPFVGHGSNVDLATLKRAHIVDTLRREHGNKMRAAKSLGISRRSLYRLLDKYQIDVT